MLWFGLLQKLFLKNLIIVLSKEYAFTCEVKQGTTPVPPSAPGCRLRTQWPRASPWVASPKLREQQGHGERVTR